MHSGSHLTAAATLRRGRALCALALALLLAACLSSPTAPALIGEGRRVLFIGNSYLYTQNIPSIVVALADSAGGDKLASLTIVAPNVALVDHLRSGVALGEIAKGGWEWVVLQQGPSSVEINRDSLRLITAIFAAEMAKVGARPALFSAWPQASRRADFPRAIESYTLAAQDVNGLLLPVASAWLAAWERDPNIRLYDDDLHPSPAGAYLSALVIYARLLDRTPKGLPHSLRLAHGATLALPAETAALLQDAAAEVTGFAGAESAAEARIAWSDAVRAERAGDVAAARRALDRSASAWPTQPAYHWARARLAAALRDTIATMQSLTRYAGLGLGRDLQDTAFAFLTSHTAYGAVVRLHDMNRSPMAQSRVAATLSDSTLWPEGVDVDPATGNLYVTSIRHRTIIEVTPEGAERDVIGRQEPGVGAVLAVHLDTHRGTLWATHAGLPQMEGWAPSDTAAELLEVRIADGKIMRRIPFDASTRHMPGGLTLTPGGDVLITDSQQPVIHRLRAGTSQFETIAHPLFRSLQGIAVTPDGGVAYVADYSHGMLRLHLGSHAVSRLAEPHGATALGLDGIALHGNAIIAVQNGVSPPRVMRYQLDDGGTRIVSASILDRNADIADGPTNGVVVGDEFLYIANSQWEKYGPDGTRLPGTRLSAPVVLALPLTLH